MDQRTDDTLKMHDILGEYKDRVTENFRRMTDEFTEDLKKLEYRFCQISEMVTGNKRMCTALDEKSKNHTVEINGIHEKFKSLKDWQKKINKLLTFETRIDLLEN